MNIWSLRKSFFTFIVAVIVFYAHFFIPVFSVDQSGLPFQNALSLPAMFGFNLHPIHYMTIGVLPFISSSLMLGVFFSMNEDLKNAAVKLQIYSLIERAILYIVAGLMAYAVIAKIPDENLPFGRFFPFLELMFSVYSIESVFKLMKSSKLVESPIVIMLSLSVVGTCLFIAISGLFSKKDLLLVLLTVIASSIFFFKKTELPISVRHIYAGNLYQESIYLRPRLLQIGIMPAVYVSIVATPVVQYFYPSTNGYAEFVVLSPQWVLALFAVLWLLAYVMLRSKFRASGLLHFGRFWDLNINECASRDLDSSMKRVALKQASFFACGVTFFVIAQGFYTHFSGGGAVQAFIGGVSWLVVMSGINDIALGWKGVHYVK